jgi:glutamine synthetase
MRKNALKEINTRQEIKLDLPKTKVSATFASNVFTFETMRNYISSEAFKNVMESIQTHQKITTETANAVANGMKAWALEKGANHFTHWFQPLRSTTAEKHDSFHMIDGPLKVIEKFKGSNLIQAEPDASSFPNGGIRSTFEARGYTAWDPTSPAFIMELHNGKTLCIPTVFISYTGESLDHKTPLLKSQHLLEKAAVDVCHFFDKNINKVFPTLGWEQEYFVIDEALFNARPDLLLTGRTLIGAKPSKGQQLSDHYFGAIPERVYNFMLDFENECYKLGIPVRTRHNEVAPGQFEVAPEFEEVNIAVDHNVLLMDIMERIAPRHKLRALLHEKPFSGVNGSGKHNNWSLATDTGKNLLAPGKTPKTNLQFLTFFVCTIKTVADYADLMRASIASASNDHRLGAHEAPPAIISVFVGDALHKTLEEIESKIEKSKDVYDKDELKLDIHKSIPHLELDNTDRNRTSPFAFTGNKFEFRAVGSTANCSLPMMVMNTAMAQTLIRFKSEVEQSIQKGKKKDDAILDLIRKYIKESKKVLFEGDGYSENWAKEAEKRGLSNVKDTPRALDAFITKNNMALFVDNKIFTKDELVARHEILLEKYCLDIHIESKVLSELCITEVIPATLKYMNIFIRKRTIFKCIRN